MKITTITQQDNIQARKHRKENNFVHSFKLMAIYKNELVEIADLRTYATNAMHYACLWIHSSKNSFYSSGSASAGGYGYHRESQACFEAFESAGVKFNESWGGSGDSSINKALNLLGRKLGYRKIYVIKSHA